MTRGAWSKVPLKDESLIARSSQCLAVLDDGHAVIFSGEHLPRTPIDNITYDVDLSNGQVKQISGDAPVPRVGASIAADGDRFYLWGGRGGTAMEPLTGEDLGVWTLKKDESWQKLPAAGGSQPEPKSYHCANVVDHRLFIHAGCPTKGRSAQLHSYDPKDNAWTQLADAPAPGRGGTVLAASIHAGRNVLIRWGGFAGFELGADNSLDVYDVSSNEWNTFHPSPDPLHGLPGPRSVHGFVGITEGPVSAVLFYGEREASALGHAGAGAFWDDVWALHWDEKQEGETGGYSWRRVEVEGERPEQRGWFASTGYKDGIVMHGGLLSDNTRSDELWVLKLSQ
ncbi:hypothetical protein PROFUN_09429 [Planoprotostelium fungivorum]|uniref:Kelch repeat-containing protein n=1 Tax=Planoprotostelium fungivorum TaxID=1890364 RepID=A0A2P6NHI4_9EUKA|nr:hypothetical protein PROFUN_09429 [Planoprotostelium fungivorum]